MSAAPEVSLDESLHVALEVEALVFRPRISGIPAGW